MDEFVAREKKTAEPINIRCFYHRFLHRDLAGKSREVTVANLYLHRARPELFPFEFAGDLQGLFLEAVSKLFPIVGIAQECFFATDTLDVIAGFKWTMIFADG